MRQIQLPVEIVMFFEQKGFCKKAFETIHYDPGDFGGVKDCVNLERHRIWENRIHGLLKESIGKMHSSFLSRAGQLIDLFEARINTWKLIDGHIPSFKAKISRQTLASIQLDPLLSKVTGIFANMNEAMNYGTAEYIDNYYETKIKSLQTEEGMTTLERVFLDVISIETTLHTGMISDTETAGYRLDKI